MFANAYATHYDVLNSSKKYKDEIDFVYKWAGRPARILDVGCGSAQYWRHFPPGVGLTGIEKSAEMRAISPFKSKIRSMSVTQMAEFTTERPFPCVTALFDVCNYTPDLFWWLKLPLMKNGYFIFDVWDKEKVDRDGFKQTVKRVGDVTRVITPISYDGKEAKLEVSITISGIETKEIHIMTIHSIDDIWEACGNKFVVDDIKKTKGWQTWYRLQKG